MGTNVRLTRSGGFAGLSMVADVDLDQLPAPAAKEVRAALAGLNFDGPAPSAPPAKGAPAKGAKPARKAAPAPTPADMYQYDLVVNDGGRHHRSLSVSEPLSDPRLQTLFDVLLPLAQPE